MKRLFLDVARHSGKAEILSPRGAIMPKYDIFAVCAACGDTHPTGISIILDGPIKKQSIAAAYRGKDIPPHLATLKQNRVYCPKMGRHYAQTDNKQIFLVPG